MPDGPNAHDALAAPQWGPACSANGQPPLLPDENAGGPDAAGDVMAELRRFHHAGPGAAAGPSLPSGLLPALLAPLRSGGSPAEATEGDAAEPGESDDNALCLLAAVAREKIGGRHARFRDRVADLHHRARGLLEVEMGKAAAGREPDALGRAMGAGAERHLDAEALARVVGPHRGSARMSETRRARIEQACQTLSEFLDSAPDRLLTVCFDRGSRASVPTELEDCQQEEHADSCKAAVDVFDREAERIACVVRAMRVVGLELDGAYDESRHDPWIAALNWEAFSREEILLVPPVAAVPDVSRLADGDLASLTRLLASGRPVQVLLTVPAAHGPTLTAAEDATGFRLELGYLGMAHRQAVVTQSTMARPEHLAVAFERGLDATRAALHVIASSRDAAGQPPKLGAWVHAAAAIEGRAHPLFRYDPEAGATLARRLRIDGNPAPESTWSVYPLVCRRADGSEETVLLPFTFADYALLEPALHAHFRVVPDSCATDGLVPLADHLELEGEEVARRLPYVWAVQPDGRLRRVIVSRALALECRDRASFWSTLQEMAGVRSEHAQEVAQRAREEVLAVAREEQKKLEDQHRVELDRAGQDAVSGAMRVLAESLLSDDPAEFARRIATGDLEVLEAVPSPVADAPPVSAEPEPVQEKAPAPAAVAEEPWVESALCTSCDDCVRINSLMFVYDENKQIRIGDPRAGTFAQLVKAAEKCPARCIHPGQPLDPGEKGLDALVRRAAAFQ